MPTTRVRLRGSRTGSGSSRICFIPARPPDPGLPRDPPRGVTAQPVLRSAAAIPAIERSSGRVRLLLAGAVAAQQLDLDRVHRVDVRVPQRDRALEQRVAVEQLAPSRRSTSTLSTARACSRFELAPRCGRARLPAGRARGRRARCACSTSRASSRGSRRARGRTASPGRACRSSRTSAPASAVPHAEPRRQQAAVLRPGEHPRDRAQRAQLVLGGSLRAATPGASRSRAAPARRPA